MRARRRKKRSAKARRIGKVTLKQVHRRASRDKRFLNALMRNPNKALKSAKLALSASDMNKLKTLLKKASRVQTKELGEFLQYVDRIGKDIAPPPPWPWPIMPVWLVQRIKRLVH